MQWFGIVFISVGVGMSPPPFPSTVCVPGHEQRTQCPALYKATVHSHLLFINIFCFTNLETSISVLTDAGSKNPIVFFGGVEDFLHIWRLTNCKDQVCINISLGRHLLQIIPLFCPDWDLLERTVHIISVYLCLTTEPVIILSFAWLQISHSTV